MAFMSRWRPKHLLLSWVAYWVGATVVKLSRAFVAASRIARVNGQGTMSANYGDKGLELTITDAGATVWHVATPLWALALWIAGPPLLLWLVWLITRERPDHVLLTTAEREVAFGTPRGVRALGEGAAPDVLARRSSRDPIEKRPRAPDDRRLR